MRHVALAALALLAPLAVAQEEARFEDATSDAFPPVANAWADITSAAMRVEGTTLALEIALAANAVMQQGVGFVFLVSNGVSDRFGAFVTPGNEQWFYGRWEGEDVGPWEGEAASGVYTTGTPATVTIEIPLDAFGAGVTTLSKPRAYAVDIKPDAIPGASYLVLDEAQADVTLSIAPPPDPTPANATSAAAPSTTTSPSPVEDLAPAAVTTPDNATRETPAPIPVLALLVGAALRCLRPWNDRAMPRR